MVDIFLLPAYEGDCILMRYGEENGVKHNILVDGGVYVNNKDVAAIIDENVKFFCNIFLKKIEIFFCKYFLSTYCL